MANIHIGTILVLFGLCFAVGYGWSGIMFTIFGAIIAAAGFASYNLFPQLNIS